MTKEFVPYQESLELKELGFDEPCFGFRSTNGNYRRFISDLGTNKDLENLFGDEAIECSTAPTFSQAFRWFRDNFGLSGWVDESFTTNNRQGVVSVKSPKGLEYIQSPKATMFFETYEEAELACLRKLIEIVEQK